MIKKGDDEIIALFKGDAEIEQLYGNENLIYDADRIHASVEDGTLVLVTDRCALFSDDDNSIALRNKAWSRAGFVYDDNKKIIKIQQYER